MKDQHEAEILAIDDAAANLRLLSKILVLRGYKVRAVTSGRRAIDAAKTHPPDLILLDVMMPDMDGYQVCAELKADPETAPIPVIFVSALDDTWDKVKAFDAGAVDYVTKPYQAEEMLARISLHLSLRELQVRLREMNVRLEKKNLELEARNAELREALLTIKSLSGLIPICAWCGRKIQDEQGQWHKVEAYIEQHSDAEFTHGICPDCLAKFKKQKYS